jgi:protein tyrosine phosphatase (PTP) superfamily phosphohydrolase (DUF442 family)
MRNAKKYDDRITIGLVPSPGDLRQLKELEYKTIIDLRDESEKFGGLVERKAKELGFQYLNIPVERDAISIDDARRFYQEVFRKGSAPLYIFSRFGKKPVVFLLLFETVVKKQALVHLYQKADKMGFRLQGDISYQSLIISVINSDEFEAMVRDIQKSSSDVLKEQFAGNDTAGAMREGEEISFVNITDALLKVTNHWIETRDEKILQANLSGMLDMLMRRQQDRSRLPT